MTAPAGGQAAAQSRGVAFALMTASAACWGIATVMSKGALAYAPPLTLLTAQLIASLAFLAVMIAIAGKPVRLDRGARRAALSGVLEPGLAYALGIAGLAMTSAANASMIGSTEPLIVVVLAFVLFRVRTGRRQLAAVAVAMAGIALASVADGPMNASALGDGLVVLATVFAALYVVVTSRLVTKIAPLPLAFFQQSVGLIAAALLLGVAYAAGFERIEAMPSVRGWWLIVSSGIVQYALAFWFYLLALRTMPVGTAALFLALIPVFGIGAAAVFLGEEITTLQAIGCTLIIGAILAAARQGHGVR